jgi:uncharacterized membrane protein/nitrite reductase/ring-hydroxylating ferredoxin subunit
MKSKANIKGHPLHPILVAFPIAFFTGTLIFDVLTFILKEDFGQTALHLEIAGLSFALIAAIPGLIDFIFTVPPKSTGKKRAAKHGLINTAVVLLFGAALYYRLKINIIEPFILLGLETAGEILLIIAGWMGGTLVYRNQIGVDPRYANAGKWKEEYLSVKDGRVEINTDEISVNQMKLVHAAGRRIVIAKTEDGYVAFDDHCTHRGGSLAGGSLICGTVQCPWHGSQFDVKTGEIKAGPAIEKIIVYTLQQSNGKFYLQLS